jgi:polysaccharide export outer membrane protein
MPKLTVLLLLSLALVKPGFGQNESLLIGAGDLVHIVVFDTPEMEQHVRVTDAGTVPLMFVGEIKIAGQTPSQASLTINRTLIEKHVMRHPCINLSVDQYATQNISVMGQVVNPGAYPISTPRSIVDVLSLAGGLTDIADRHITVQHHGDENQQTTYYFSNDPAQAFKNKIMLNPGDTVIVPKAPIVYVLGDVGRPGGFPVNTNDSQMTVLQAVAMAGAANKTAIRSKVRLLRHSSEGRHEMLLSLAKMEKGEVPDMALEPDDIIYVPFSYMKNIAVNGSSIAASATSAAIYR